MESFEELNLPEFLAKNLKQMNFTKPTPVQAQAIPAALAGKDVIASAQTGTGKTGAFGVPLAAYLDAHKEKTALVMTPTRELAQQVLDVLRKISGNVSNGQALLIGGANMQAQFQSLKRNPRLIIGTPGRIIDHLTRGSLVLSKTGFLVLDEADRMLDMGFAPQLEEIRKKLPPVRQTLLFSATFPSDIQRMATSYLKDPVRITIGTTTQPVEKINQEIVYTTESRKFEQLMEELKERQGSVVVFARTQVRVDRVSDKLKDLGIKVTRIHGGRTQSQRRQAIEQFREGKFLVLVATDIAARGLDIHHIAHVINYDLPKNPEDYIHRVGRTARAGAEGNSICLLTPEDRSLWERILRLLGNARGAVKVKPSSHPGFMSPSTSKPQEFRSDRPRHDQNRSFQPRHDKPRSFQGQGDHREHREHRFERNDFKNRHDHDKEGPKQRHPDGRHERRSEGHRQRLAQTPGAAPSHEGPRSFDRPGADRHRPVKPFEKREFRKDFSGNSGATTTPWGAIGASEDRSLRNNSSRGEYNDRRPAYGDRKPFGDRPRGDKPFRKEFRPRPSAEGGEANFNREDRNRSRPPFGERKSFGDRKPFGARKSFGGDNRNFGDKRPFKPNSSFGTKDRAFGDQNAYGDRKPFRSKPAFGDRKPFNGERKSFGGERKSFGDRKPFGKPFGGGDRKPFRSDRPSGGNRKPHRFGQGRPDHRG